MSGGALVYVATTLGPSRVCRIVAEDPALHSVMCLDGETRALPVSADYDSFVRSPTGVVERAVGHPAFRTDVSEAIDTGTSWQLPLYIAHLLAARGALLETDDAAPMIWSTGVVSYGGAVLAVGEIARKVTAARPLLEAGLAEGRRVYAVVPPGNRDALAEASPPAGVSILSPETLDDLPAVIAKVLQNRTPAGPEGRGPAVRRRHVGTAIALVAASMAVLVPAGQWRTPQYETVRSSEITSGADPGGGTGTEYVVPTISAAAGLTAPIVIDARQSNPPATSPPAGRSGLEVIVRPLNRGGLDSCAVPGAPLPAAELDVRPSLSGCGLRAELLNYGPAPVDVGLVLRFAGGVAEYSRGGKTRSEVRGRISPGERLAADLVRPAWIRRSMHVDVVAQRGAASEAAEAPEPDPIVKRIRLIE